MGMSMVSFPGIGVLTCMDVGIITLPTDRTETPTVDPLYAGSDRDISLGIDCSTTHAHLYGISRLRQARSPTPQKKNRYDTSLEAE